MALSAGELQIAARFGDACCDWRTRPAVATIPGGAMRLTGRSATVRLQRR